MKKVDLLGGHPYDESVRIHNCGLIEWKVLHECEVLLWDTVDDKVNANRDTIISIIEILYLESDYEKR